MAIARAHRPVFVVGTHAAAATTEVGAAAEAFEVGVLAADLTDLAVLRFPTTDPHYIGVYGEQPGSHSRQEGYFEPGRKGGIASTIPTGGAIACALKSEIGRIGWNKDAAKRGRRCCRRTIPTSATAASATTMLS